MSTTYESLFSTNYSWSFQNVQETTDEWEYENPPNFIPYSFEHFDIKWWLKFARENWFLSVYASILYICLIFGIKAYMKNRPPFKLKTALFLWNGALGVFSIVGFIRYVPEFTYVLYNQGFHGGLCRREGLNRPLAFYSLLFTLSKFVELGDTIFIVLRKKPLVFLQWYHHAITLNASWIMVPYLEPIVRWFAFMNYGVHSMMYPYFALKAIDVNIPKRIANCITIAQLSQMVFGLAINLYTILVIATGTGDCIRHPSSIKMFLMVYGSFTLLFGDLLYNAMFASRKKGIKKD